MSRNRQRFLEDKKLAKLNYPSKRSGKEVISRYDFLKGGRFVWDNHWRECADYTLPRKNDILRQQIAGSKKALDLFDTTAMHSAELLASALHGLLTNPSSFFFGLTTGEPDLDDDDDIRAWLEDTTLKMHNAINDSNFQTEVHEYYLDEVVFGTAPMTIEEDPKNLFRFRSWHVKNCFLEEDPQGMVNGVHRYFEWTPENIVRRFGIESCSKIVQDAFKGGQNSDKKFGVVHAVYQKNPEESDPHEFISQYVEHETKKELSLGGFHEFPYIAARWTKISEEVYGRSPAMTALPEAKTINEMTKQTLVAAQKMVDPPLTLPDDGYVLPIKTKPGGLNYKRPGVEKIEPLFSHAINLDISDKEREQARARIREAFYVDQLSLGTNNPQMTATEVNARNEQAMTLLGPMLGRQQSEFLQPMIIRIFAIMNRKKLFKPMPQKLAAHGKLTPQYTSLIAKAQRLVDAKAINRFIDAITPFANTDPSVLDNIDTDRAANLLAKITGVPQSILRTQRDVKKIRDNRAQMQKKQQEQQDQQHQAEVASKALPAQAQMLQAVKNNQGNS